MDVALGLCSNPSSFAGRGGDGGNLAFNHTPSADNHVDSIALSLRDDDGTKKSSG